MKGNGRVDELYLDTAVMQSELRFSESESRVAVYAENRSRGFKEEPKTLFHV